MAFIYIGCFVLFVVIVVNISSYNEKEKKKQHQKSEPRRFTIDSLKDITQNNIKTHHKKFENTIEETFRKHIAQCLKDTPNELKNTPIITTFIMDS